jgi:hypothetical protein
VLLKVEERCPVVLPRLSEAAVKGLGGDAINYADGAETITDADLLLLTTPVGRPTDSSEELAGETLREQAAEVRRLYAEKEARYRESLLDTSDIWPTPRLRIVERNLGGVVVSASSEEGIQAALNMSLPPYLRPHSERASSTAVNA